MTWSWTPGARRRPIAWVLAAASILALLVVPPLSPMATAASGSGPPRPSSAWIPFWSSASYQRVVANRDLFHTASPFWYDAPSIGTVVPYRGAVSPGQVAGLHAAGISVVRTVTSSMTAKYAARRFSDATARRQHVAALMRVVNSGKYDGLDLNYETIALTTDTKVAERVRAGFSKSWCSCAGACTPRASGA